MEPSLKDIRLLKEHDEYTYDKLRNYYINKLCYYIFDRYHFLLCDCQDLAEDIFVKAAYINIASYDPSKSSFTTWLFAIANNECLHFIRTNQYKNHDMNVENIPSNDTTHGFIYEIRLILDKEEYKYLIEYALYDLSIKEIATQNNVTRQTVHRKLKSAKEKVIAYKEKKF